MRTIHMPPARASTLHSLARGGAPPQLSPCAANIRGGSQAVAAERGSVPGPNFSFMATGFPCCSSISAGTNQDEIPGPVAMACQTSSGVPGTSSSTCKERRPEASFFTLITAPWSCDSSGGAPTLLGRCRTNDHGSATGARERHAIASHRLVEEARDLRTSECGRALQVDPAHHGGPLQQLRGIG